MPDRKRHFKGKGGGDEGNSKKKGQEKLVTIEVKKRSYLVSWCFEPSKPQRITSGLMKKRGQEKVVTIEVKKGQEKVVTIEVKKGTGKSGDN